MLTEVFTIQNLHPGDDLFLWILCLSVAGCDLCKKWWILRTILAFQRVPKESNTSLLFGTLYFKTQSLSSSLTHETWGGSRSTSPLESCFLLHFCLLNERTSSPPRQDLRGALQKPHMSCQLMTFLSSGFDCLFYTGRGILSVVLLLLPLLLAYNPLPLHHSWLSMKKIWRPLQ